MSKASIEKAEYMSAVSVEKAEYMSKLTMEKAEETKKFKDEFMAQVMAQVEVREKKISERESEVKGIE